MSNFETLVNDFPIFTVKNKQNVSKNILLKNNEELVVPPNGTVTIESKLLLAVPSSVIFKAVSPSVSDYIKYGVLTSKSKKAPVEEPNNSSSSSFNSSKEASSKEDTSYDYDLNKTKKK